MRTIQKRKNYLGQLVIPAITASCIGYFALHAHSGQYGIEEKADLARQLADRSAKLDELTVARVRLEKRVQLLHDGTLERDMIDERARRALNVVAANEIVILR